MMQPSDAHIFRFSESTLPQRLGVVEPRVGDTSPWLPLPLLVAGVWVVIPSSINLVVEERALCHLVQWIPCRVMHPPFVEHTAFPPLFVRPLTSMPAPTDRPRLRCQRSQRRVLATCSGGHGKQQRHVREHFSWRCGGLLLHLGEVLPGRQHVRTYHTSRAGKLVAG